jgi:Mo-dependent nitrogenase C-terminus
MNSIAQKNTNLAFLKPIRNWIENFQIDRIDLAYSICKLIPAQCPFEREIYLGSQKILQIPPLCKLNPLYEELVGLRFRALCYLADECGEDISHLLA